MSRTRFLAAAGGLLLATTPAPAQWCHPWGPPAPIWAAPAPVYYQPTWTWTSPATPIVLPAPKADKEAPPPVKADEPAPEPRAMPRGAPKPPPPLKDPDDAVPAPKPSKKLPADLDDGKPKVSAPADVFQVYAVSREAAPASGSGEQGRVAFFNHSDREVVIEVAERTHTLPSGGYVKLRLSRDFVWREKGGEARSEQVPADAAGIDIVIRK